jgi:hypothetical protein
MGQGTRRVRRAVRLTALTWNDGAACKLDAFRRELEAQRDRHIDITAYDRLRPQIDRFGAQHCPPT